MLSTEDVKPLLLQEDRPVRDAAADYLRSSWCQDTPIAKMDVFNFWLSKEGKNGTYAQTVLRSNDLTRPAQYADYWLDFEHGSTGKVEYRVWWPGSASLSLDRIVIFRKP